jgi:GDP-D-mannose dehydratase
MALNETQIKLLTGIQSNLKYGDINSIAEKTGFAREYVGKSLSLSNDYFNEDIVAAAVEIISAREHSAKQLLKKLPTESVSNNNTQEPQLQETN